MDLNRFPLIRLPMLAISVILHNMELMDIFLFTRLSNRAKMIVKGYFKVRGYTMNIFVLNAFTFEIATPTRPKTRISVTNQNIGTVGFEQTIGGTSGVRCLDETEENTRKLWMHWDDKLVGLKAVYEELSYFFAIPIPAVFVNLNRLGEECKELIQWLDTLKISEISISGENSDFTICMWILENIKSIKKVQLYAEPREYLEAEPYTIEAKSLNISYGQWVKPGHIQQMEAKEIWIYMIDLTNAQIIEIMDNLKSGSNPDLKTLRLALNRQLGDLLEIILQLDDIEVHETSIDLKLNEDRMCIITFVNLAEEGAEQRVGIKLEIRGREREENN